MVSTCPQSNPTPVAAAEDVASKPSKTLQHPSVAQGAVITRRAADRLRAGHLWVYASDIEAVNVPPREANPPALLPVADNRGILLGTALYSPASQIALRLISRDAIDHAAFLKLLERPSVGVLAAYLDLEAGGVGVHHHPP